LKGATTGRSDQVPITVAPGAYVIPADVVAALGDGNSDAGHKLLEQRFPAVGPKKKSSGVGIIVSHGEYVISPDVVASLGGGDVNHGHDVLDAFVTKTRRDNIQKLKSLPGPQT